MCEPGGLPSAGNPVLAERYELGELVGRGGMAEVYRARDRLLDRTVAVKVFRSQADPAAQRRLDSEAVALARLAHRGLVSIFDVGSVDDRPFLVMEFVDGVGLHLQLLSGPLPVEHVRRLGAALAGALAHVHERGVIHRDVKPSNIILDRDGSPHLTDFGIALLAGEPRLTNADQIIGTPAYLAPEQLSDTAVGPAADVYALGLVLLECLTGEVEYPSDSGLEAALTRLHRPPRIPAGLPPDFADVLTAMTATQPLDRPAAAECAERLASAQSPDAPVIIAESVAWPADEPATERIPVPMTAGPAAHRPRRALLAAALAGVAAVLVTLVFLLNIQQPPANPAPAQSDHAPSQNMTTPGQPAPAAGGGRGAAGPAGTLVVNEHVGTTPAAPPPAASSAPAESHPTSTTTASSSAPATTTSAVPTTTSTTSAPPTTTSTAP